VVDHMVDTMLRRSRELWIAGFALADYFFAQIVDCVHQHLREVLFVRRARQFVGVCYGGGDQTDGKGDGAEDFDRHYSCAGRKISDGGCGSLMPKWYGTEVCCRVDVRHIEVWTLRYNGRLIRTLITEAPRYVCTLYLHVHYI